MAPHFEAPLLEVRDVERSPIPALEPQTDERSAALDDRSSQEVLKEAQRLLMQILSILNDPICTKRSTAAGSFRLARGHALTLLDHLKSMAPSTPRQRRHRAQSVNDAELEHGLPRK